MSPRRTRDDGGDGFGLPTLGDGTPYAPAMRVRSMHRPAHSGVIRYVDVRDAAGGHVQGAQRTKVKGARWSALVSWQLPGRAAAPATTRVDLADLKAY